MTLLAVPAGVTVSAAGGANGILVLVALLLVAVATLIAVIDRSRNWWAVLVSAGLGVYLAALLVGS